MMRGKKKTRILLFPKPYKSNPYIYNVFNNLKKEYEVITASSKLDYFRFWKFDVIYLNWIENFGADSFFFFSLFTVYFLLIRMIAKKIVWVLHNKIPHNITSEKNKKRAKKFMKILAKLSNIIIVHSNIAKDYAVQVLKANSSKILVVPHGNYLYNYTPLEKTKREKIVFGYVGQIKPYKNLEMLLDLFCSRDKNSEFLVFGQPYSEEYKQQLLEKYSKCANIRLELRFIEDEEIPEVFRSIDILILSYDEESFLTSGTAILAFSMKTPIIAPRIGMFLEYEDKEFVFLYRNEKELEEIIGKVSALPQERLLYLGEIAYNFAKKELDWEIFINALRNHL